MKLKIWLLEKPEVIFDPAKKEHRQAYHNFLKDKSWKTSKYRFILEDDHHDIPHSINNKLIEYYIQREFNQN